MKPLNIAIVGCGSIVQAHLTAIGDFSSLVAVCDINKDRADKIANITSSRAYYQVDDLIQNESLDVVHLLTPHHVRFEIIEKLAKASIHVLVEKPVGMNLSEGKKVEELAGRFPQIKIGVIFQNRFNETTVRLHELIAQGVIGEVAAIRGYLAWDRDAGYYRAGPWRGEKKTAGGGVLINQAIHSIDLIQQLGGEVVDIDSTTHSFRNKHLDVEDTANLFIRFANGISGSFYATIAHRNNSPVEIEVTGSEGRLIIQNYALWLDHEDAPLEKICDDSASGVKAYYGGGHGSAVEQFHQAVNYNSDNYVHVSDALKSLAIIEQVYQQN